MVILLTFLASLLSCAGQLCQKHAATLPPSPSCGKLGHRLHWMGISFLPMGIAMLLWLWILQQVPVGIAYSMFSLNFVLITLSTRWLWREPASLQNDFGLILMITGLIFMGVNL
ncbi:4-amino-4-deoxy-L-arabinose-phosphoundecaprenol flippase subunit ArnE [Candidatus Steffania adelgidicola]|uniref:4-amino-4-deoxy-L-arabinose-phosphoundecaprenol flippase subunit ArnE n=1 Tax=Candidatus Steffania adelgidicola TaxID=1076626 RepID=UPI001D0128DE|nr:4-amino-4-deoxy-L-arabinose-phosphoundecaprenol flippase subunit ArnE [Candidatus Steffania adelgidicola]UDG79939.1 putative 4-amino-4-deoxy-L-arabinose-phosphoundecaprenol flippase subunit ArnE [Candidatus Steffania adelgidicola]